MSNAGGFRISDSGREQRWEVTCVNKRVSRRKAQDKADPLAKILENLATVWFPDQQQPPPLGMCWKCRVSGPHLTS